MRSQDILRRSLTRYNTRRPIEAHRVGLRGNIIVLRSRSIVRHLIFCDLALLFLKGLSVPVDQFTPALVIELIAEAGTGANQSTKALSIEHTKFIHPIGSGVAVGIELIIVEVRIKIPAQTQRKTRRETEGNRSGDIAPTHGVCHHVVACSPIELVDQTNLLEGLFVVRSIALGCTDLHLQVVGETKRNGPGLTTARRPKDTIAIEAIRLFVQLPIGGCILHSAVVTPKWITKIGTIPQRNGRGNAVANHLHFVSKNLPRLIESV